jgi:hypothetical protein
MVKFLPPFSKGEVFPAEWLSFSPLWQRGGFAGAGADKTEVLLKQWLKK